MLNFIFFCVGCLFMSIIFKFYANRIVFNKLQSYLLSSNWELNFEKDIYFLEYMITYKVENYNQFVLNADQINKNNLINDKMISKACQELFIEVKNVISDTYMVILLKYFSSNGLDNYIADRIYTSLLKIAINKNGKIINSINADSFFKRINFKEEKQENEITEV